MKEAAGDEYSVDHALRQSVITLVESGGETGRTAVVGHLVLMILVAARVEISRRVDLSCGSPDQNSDIAGVPGGR